MGRTLMMYDTLNNMTVKRRLDRMAESEISMLWEVLLEDNPLLGNNDLLVFDRYLASHLLIFYLHHIGVKSCFRLKKDWWKITERFYKSGKQSQVLMLELPRQDTAKAKQLGIGQTKIKVRMVRVELEGGETEILLTTPCNERTFTAEDIAELYGLRWTVEDGYKTFKRKVCIENFSGKSPKAVLQDFYVKLFIMNLTAAAIRPINEALKKATVKVKYPHQANVIEAIATMKKAVISFFVTGKIKTAIERVVRRLSTVTEPVRKGRQFKRKHLPW